MKNIKIKILALACVVILAGCDEFLDINADPNNPTRAQLSTLLPYVQANLFGALGFGTAGITDILGVYNHHTVQRGNHDDYKIQANEFALTQTWEKLYAVGLVDLNQIIKQAEEEGRPDYSGIAKLLKAHAFSAMVDLWGDIPYSEAGDPATFPFPHFDDDMAIYADLFLLIDSGLADIANAGSLKPGADDLVYGGAMSKWADYGRSLKLNLYNHVRLTSLYDAGEVAELLASPLMAQGNDFELRYGTSNNPENRNPAYVREYAQNSPAYYISPYFWLLMNGQQACQNSLMNGIVDPRVPYYFYNQLAPGEAAQNPESYRNGEFLTIWFGSFDRDPNEGFDQANSQTLIGLYPGGGAYDNGSGVNLGPDLGTRGASPQRLLTAAAIDFVRAELALTEGTGEDARALLESGMRKAFAEVNTAAPTGGAPAIDAGAIDDYVNAVLALYDAGSDDTKLEIVMTQKWIQEFGNGIESYNDIRRTGYPQICDPAQDDNEYSIQTNPYPVSLPYSSNDLTNNGNAPAQRNQYLDKVFWDN
jgi:hypothetical protein